MFWVTKANFWKQLNRTLIAQVSEVVWGLFSVTDATTRTMEVVFGGGEQTSIGNNSPSPRSSDTIDV